MTIRIRNSEIAAFRRCRRKWLNAYVLNLTNEATPEQRFSRPPGTNATGTYAHALLEAHYGEQEQMGDAYRGGPDAVSNACYAEIPEDSPFQQEWEDSLRLSEIMFDGYLEWVSAEGLDQGEATHGTEVSLEWEIMPGVFVTGKIDRIVHDTTWDRYIIEDYKTVQTLEKGPQFQVDTQLLTYVLLANKNGIPCNDARHTMLRRVKRSAKAKPPFYGRAEVTFSDEQLRRHEQALMSTVKEMLKVRAWYGDEPGLCYPNPTKDCSWDCPFIQICAAHDDGSDIDGLRKELFTVREEGDK